MNLWKVSAICVPAWLDPTGTMTANNGEETGFSERQVKARFIVMLTQSGTVFPTKSWMLSTWCWTHPKQENHFSVLPRVTFVAFIALHKFKLQRTSKQVFLMASHNCSCSSFHFLAWIPLQLRRAGTKACFQSSWWWITKPTGIFICVLYGGHPSNCKFFSLRRMRIRWSKLNNTSRVNKHEDRSKLCNVALYDSCAAVPCPFNAAITCTKREITSGSKVHLTSFSSLVMDSVC